MESHETYQQIVKRINGTLPLHSLWDGFWVHGFRRGMLIISCSFNRIYYRDNDLVFQKAIFFNVPDSWRDTQIDDDDLLRLATRAEFTSQHPGFDTKGLPVFAIDLHANNHAGIRVGCTFYIVAKHLYLIRCAPDNNNPVPTYTDPFANEPYPCSKNRVPH